jgi:hypothetical protein
MDDYNDQVKEDGHVERMGRRGMHIGYWWESHEEIYR